MRRRSGTLARDALLTFAYAQTPQQIVFMHVPKTAGTSLRAYIRDCVGGKRSGRMVALRSELRTGSTPIDSCTMEAARCARFCTGHIFYETANSVQSSQNSFVFTILREPRHRLWSQYRYLRDGKYPHGTVSEDVADLYDDITRMTPLEFFSSTDSRIRELTDNIMVRQFGGTVLEARRNLEKLDYVGFTETFDHDVPRILKAVNLPVPSRIPRLKVSNSFRDMPTQSNDVTAAMAPLVELDSVLYEHALRLTKERPLVIGGVEYAH